MNRDLLRLAVSGLLLLLLLAGLTRPLGPAAPLGSLLNPVTGIWYMPSPRGDERVAAPGLSAPVQVLYDRLGIPHIFASAPEELAFGLGYVHARDRLFQMDAQRRLAEGRFAEVVGPPMVETDTFMRHLGLERTAERMAANMSDEERRLTEAYARGVNHYIARTPPKDLPLEFRVLGYTPRPWTPVDTLAYGKLVAWFMTGDFGDLENQLLEEKFGPERVWNDLFLLDNNLTIPIIPEEEIPLHLRKPDALRSSAGAAARANTGSNNFVVGPNKTATGGAIVGSDPHLQIQLPSFWYEAHLSAPGLQAYGATAPGLPVVLIGHNGRLAWGMTNVGPDNVDFYEYAWDTKGRYLHDGEWKEPRVRMETLQVKGQPDLQVPIRETVHGPLLQRHNKTYALRWACSAPTREGLAILLINKAANYTQFLEGLRHWQCPPLNFVYGDDRGNIALWSAGLYPLREPNVSGRVPTNGSRVANGWKENPVPFEEVPKALNPLQGYLTSSNQLPARNYTHDIGWDFADGFRSRRLNELLRPSDNQTTASLRPIQTDVLSVEARALIPYLLAAYDANPDPATRDAVDLLRTWDHRMRRGQPAPVLAAETLKAYRDQTFKDEYAQAGAQEARLPPMERLESLTKNEPNSRWFDDVTTPQRETRDDILRRALQTGAREAARKWGPDPRKWSWTDAHRILALHVSGLKSLSRGPFPVDGWHFTVSPTSILPDQDIHREARIIPLPKEATTQPIAGGASYRLLVDLSRPQEAIGALPGGESGDPLSPHYTDQLQMWTDMQYHPLQFPQKPEELQEVESRLTLTP